MPAKDCEFYSPKQDCCRHPECRCQNSLTGKDYFPSCECDSKAECGLLEQSLLDPESALRVSLI